MQSFKDHPQTNEEKKKKKKPVEKEILQRLERFEWFFLIGRWRRFMRYKGYVIPSSY